MGEFKDSTGHVWRVGIVTGDLDKVESLVKDKDGNPVSITNIIDRADFSSLKKDIRTMIDVVFVLLLDQIAAEFDLAKYDADMEATYELLPAWRDDSKSQKMQRWFAARINSQVLSDMTDALLDAIIFFTPGQTRRDALKAIYDKEMEVERETDAAWLEESKTTLDKAVPIARRKMRQVMDARLQSVADRPIPTAQQHVEFGSTPEL